MSELINKQTTSNWSDEKDALAVYKRAAGLIKAMLSEYKMSKMKKFVSDAMKKADYILQLVPTAEQRPHGRYDDDTLISLPLHLSPIWKLYLLCN